jgi:hypothetical protein
VGEEMEIEGFGKGGRWGLEARGLDGLRERLVYWTIVEMFLVNSFIVSEEINM